MKLEQETPLNVQKVTVFFTLYDLGGINTHISKPHIIAHTHQTVTADAHAVHKVKLWHCSCSALTPESCPLFPLSTLTFYCCLLNSCPTVRSEEHTSDIIWYTGTTGEGKYQNSSCIEQVLVVSELTGAGDEWILKAICCYIISWFMSTH